MWGGLVDMYEAGLVRAVGVSNYGPKQLAKIARFLEQHEVPLVSVQIQYSLLSQTAETAGAAAACADLGLQMIAYSPLALGMAASRCRPARAARSSGASSQAWTHCTTQWRRSARSAARR